MMVGDQIYADDLRSVAPDKTLTQFYERYRSAFSQEHIRELMGRVPTYMTLDDHEIEDNWPERASERDWKTPVPDRDARVPDVSSSVTGRASVCGGRGSSGRPKSSGTPIQTGAAMSS